MGKKIQAEMDAQRARFVQGCGANDIAPPKANELFDLIDKFAGYGFNKSHAAAYALVAYHTAWLKAHYPAEFFAASMSFEMDQTEKLCIFAEDLRRSGVELRPPHVNLSRADFSVEDGAVRYALGALKGVGEKAMLALVKDREAVGPFPSLDVFAERIDPRLLNRRQLESLAGAGAFDVFGHDRAAVHGGAETILAHAASAAHQRESGQGGLFGGASDAGVAPIRLPRDANWSLAERMAAERDAFGFYFSDHPVDHHKHLLAAHRVRASGDLAAVPLPTDGGRAAAAMAGLVEAAAWRTSAKGRRYLTARLSDAAGQFEATVFDDDTSAAVEHAAKAGLCGLLQVELDRRPGEDQPRITIRKFQALEDLAKRSRLELMVRLNEPDQVIAIASELTLAKGKGAGLVRMVVPISSGREAVLVLGRDFGLDAELVARLERQCGEGRVTLSVQEPPKLSLVG
jgi:DNA polymerase-3 subunit alpha